MNWKLFVQCLFSPSLYSIHRGSPANLGAYNPNDWERWGDNFITSFVFLRTLTVYTSPLLMFLMARKGYLSVGGALYLAKLSLGVGLLVGASYCLRSYGRLNNSKYRLFLTDLQTAKSNYTDLNNKKKIRNYDFEFSFWPVDYETKRRGRNAVSKKRWWSYLVSPCGLLSYIVIHSVGIRLIYPGSIPFINYLMGGLLIEGRQRLVVTEKGQRYKLKTEDGNYIDCMFLDRRQDSNREKGKTLVICSEGNAGFYESGIMATPIQANYSVLGWNHPGFGASTGLPYVEEEQKAVDVVVEFALDHLHFLPENIVLYGWSIGGYSTAYAALNHPDVRAVIIDASFDDLVPLAVPRMPAVLEGIVRRSVRQQANLDVARKLLPYPGPILLVRRSADEVITTEPEDLSTNRGNHLLYQVLNYRYPALFNSESEQGLSDWLSTTSHNQSGVLVKYRVDGGRCDQILSSYFSSNDQTFPLDLGDGLDPDLKTQLLLYLASKYMVDFDSTHCTILPADYFQIPALPSGQTQRLIDLDSFLETG